MPTSPQWDAGIRIEPPVSDPIPPGAIRAATAAPVPPLDPPALRSRSHGFLVGGVYTPHANSCIVVFPRTIAPTALSLGVPPHMVLVDRDEGVDQRFDGSPPVENQVGQLRKLQLLPSDQLSGLDHVERPGGRRHSRHYGSKTVAGSISSTSSTGKPPPCAIWPSSCAVTVSIRSSGSSTRSIRAHAETVCSFISYPP